MTKNLTFTQISAVLNDNDKARELLESLRWKDGVVCPHCEGTRIYTITPKEGSKTRKGLRKCGSCRKQFTVTVGTIFEGSHISLGKWLMAVHLICASKKGMSSKQLQRQLDLSYEAAWFMSHRIRYAMGKEPLVSKLRGTVEVDETFVGGKAKNMHRSEHKKRITGGGSSDKAPVVTLVERDGRVQTRHVEHITALNLKKAMRECIAPSAIIMTDEHPSYTGSNRNFADHQVVCHSKGEYVRGLAHTNTAESVHALLKRGVFGTYHHWSKKHLHRYLSEFDFRWNTRKMTDSERTLEALNSIGGKRLQYTDPKKTKTRD